MWLHICETVAYLSTKLLLEEKAKTKKKKKCLVDSRDETMYSTGFLRPHV